MRRLACLLPGLLLLLSCSDDTGRTGTDAGRDGMVLTDAPTTCTPGSMVCAGSSARLCQANGTPAATGTDCTLLGQVCVGGTGCALCRPGATRCNPTDAQTVQTCAADGTGYADSSRCDDRMAQTCQQGACVDRCDPRNNTYLGCEYFPTVTANSALPRTFRFNVVVVNPNSYEVRMQIDGGALRTPVVRLLASQTTTRVELPWVDALVQNNQTSCGASACVATSALVDAGNYHLTTNGPVAVYQFNPLEYRARDGTYSRSNDASLLLPVGALGSQYLVNTFPNWTQPAAGMTPGGVRGGFVTVVATDTSGPTNLMVRLTAPVSAGMGVTASPAGTVNYQLNPGQTLQLVSTGAGQDLSGTLVQADHPVAVFAGHDCTQVPLSTPACDHIEEQLLPTTAWGKHYVVSPFRARGASEQSVVRLMAQTDGVRLSFDGITPPAACMATLNRGQFCEITTPGGFSVTSTLPFGVTQFMLGQGQISAACNVPMPPNMAACVGDPDMVLEVPVEQFRVNYDFLVPMDDFTGADAVYRYYANYVNVVAPMGASIQLDRMPLPGTQTALGGGYGMWVVPLQPGPHHIETSNEQQRFGIKVYGVAPYTSYTFPGGLDIAAIAPPG